MDAYLVIAGEYDEAWPVLVCTDLAVAEEAVKKGYGHRIERYPITTQFPALLCYEFVQWEDGTMERTSTAPYESAGMQEAGRCNTVQRLERDGTLPMTLHVTVQAATLDEATGQASAVFTAYKVAGLPKERAE